MSIINKTMKIYVFNKEMQGRLLAEKSGEVHGARRWVNGRQYFISYAEVIAQ